MKRGDRDDLERCWVRAGVLFNCAPAPDEPDLEALFIESAKHAGRNARLLPLAVTWLVEHGRLVARHRLRGLIAAHLTGRDSAVMGLLLESARSLGAPRDLAVAIESCRARSPASPLYEEFDPPGIRDVASRHASALSRKWGVWCPEIELKRDAVRPLEWILARNPGYRSRLVRKGDLRCSILETLKHTPGRAVGSVSELARLCGATRVATARAVEALIAEAQVTTEHANDRDRAVVLSTAA